MTSRYVVHMEDADTGVLPGDAGTFRILIDEQQCGAKNYAMLIKSMKAGLQGSEHAHDVNEQLSVVREGYESHAGARQRGYDTHRLGLRKREPVQPGIAYRH